MKLLLDTHMLIWWQANDPRLPKALVELVQSQVTDVFVSHASLWEIAIKQSLGKIDINLTDLLKFSKQTGFQWLEIDEQAILAVNTLPAIANHKDPFDRMLIAQSMVHHLTFMTSDKKMSLYPALVKVF
ncbi:MAG: type II toxin-antitoxin system VapC family toxin [Moraxella sp.]|nr:type II toxin-antitoxin system VapC family toxin [Moraxella sp.]